MKRLLMTALAVLTTFSFAAAQRMTDKLDRGLVAVKTDGGVFCSWRILGEEYYDVTYNIYRDGTKLNAEPLQVSNFVDASGSEGSKYTVTAVVRGKEQAQSEEATVWSQGWLEITPDHGNLASTYQPNDACMADVDGDGQLEILIKMWNQSDVAAGLPREGYQGEYSLIEVYKLNGKKLWWIECGPNLTDFQNNETNIVAYDWDGDGKAEALMRAADGTVIHMADGSTQTIGDATKNYRPSVWGGQTEKFVHDGAEYLVYMNGETGEPYQVMEYPLKRLEVGETSLEAAWGDGYGHRSTKHFFGAPYLDGRKPSIFLARGIYTRHKMIALDVNPETHELTERWRWNCSNSNSPWYGNGYHNYAIADVDWDGRDEICFGSMVIDDNGKGLSTTGYGHGDAQHHGDFNPYIHGQEIFACLEDSPYWGNNLRDGTTSKVYYKFTSGRDDGRCMAGNFTNDYPGAMAFSGYDTPISCVTADHIPGLEKGTIPDNFRIYWDGDLLDEGFNYANGKNTAGGIYKHGKGLIQTLTGSMTNNDTKGTPCYQGDILGDWREEVIMRTSDNKIRIYTTTIPTAHRLYTLWHDHQYRQAMVWQMCGYNQPPHVSYFVGELEGITQAPPALTTTNRIEVNNGEMIADVDIANPQWLLAETADATVVVQDGCSPDVVIVNTPTWVQGHDDNNNITTQRYTHTLTGGAFTGSMRLVKQGDGTLVLPNVTQTYSGPTDVWAGQLMFDGTMQKSRVWLNRFAELHSRGGKFMNGIKMDYASVLRPTGTVETDSLLLGFGARITFGISDGSSDGSVKAGVLTIEKKDWQYGPQYKTPVIEIVTDAALAEGRYLLIEAGKIEGSVKDFVLEGTDGVKAKLIEEDGKIWLEVQALRQAAKIAWSGGTDGVWDFAETENFRSADGKEAYFVTGDEVSFGDEASQTAVVISDNVAPSSLLFTNSEKDYTLSGSGSIIGSASLTKRGSGSLTISNTNRMTGDITIEDGVLTVSALANSSGAEYGSIGGTTTPIILKGGTLATPNTVVTTQPVGLSGTGSALNVAAGKTMTLNGGITSSGKATLHKTGNGTLTIGGAARYSGALWIDQGTVQGGETGNVHQYPDTVVINGGTLVDPDDVYTYSSNNRTIVVPEGVKGTWTLDSRCDYRGKLLGAGELMVNVTSVRCNMTGDWSQFAGTLNFQNKKTGSYNPSLQWNNDYGLGKATVKGNFENNGKSVTIGRIAENVSITGNGRTTVRHIDMRVTKSRSGIRIPSIEVDGTLVVSEAITITFSGTALKAGEVLNLWTAKAFQSTSNVVITLPELPAGLYWDASELLTKEGKLKVTDTPTGIETIGRTDNLQSDNAVYDLRGRKMPEGGRLPKGVYIKNGKKIVVK